MSTAILSCHVINQDYKRIWRQRENGTVLFRERNHGVEGLCVGCWTVEILSFRRHVPRWYTEQTAFGFKIYWPLPPLGERGGSWEFMCMIPPTSKWVIPRLSCVCQTLPLKWDLIYHRMLQEHKMEPYLPLLILTLNPPLRPPTRPRRSACWKFDPRCITHWTTALHANSPIRNRSPAVQVQDSSHAFAGPEG